MEKRIWITLGKVTKTEPMDSALSIEDLKVRSGDVTSIAFFDGIWIRGNRSYETWVLIDGVVSYHSPREDLAQMSFAEHERQGGGHSVA